MITSGGVTFDPDWARELEHALDEEFTRLGLALDSEDPDVECVDVTGEPYCGCPTCDQRVTLAIVIKATLQGVRDGLVELA